MSDGKLMDIAAEYREALERLNDLDLPEAVVNDTLEGMAGAIEVKATSLIAFAERLEALSGVSKKRRQEMAKRDKSMDDRAERIRQFVFAAMKLAKISLIETTEFKLRVKGGVKKVIIDAPTQIPPEYMRFPDPPPPEVDKERIKSVLDAGAKAQALFSSGKPITPEQAQAIEDAKAIDFAHLEQVEFLEVR